MFFKGFKDCCFNKNVCNFDDVSKIGNWYFEMKVLTS